MYVLFHVCVGTGFVDCKATAECNYGKMIPIPGDLSSYADNKVSKNCPNIDLNNFSQRVTQFIVFQKN